MVSCKVSGIGLIPPGLNISGVGLVSPNFFSFNHASLSVVSYVHGIIPH